MLLDPGVYQNRNVVNLFAKSRRFERQFQADEEYSRPFRRSALLEQMYKDGWVHLSDSGELQRAQRTPDLYFMKAATNWVGEAALDV